MAENTAPKKKRLVKNPETFRERAIKAAEAFDKPSKRSRLTFVGGKVAKPVVNPIGRLLRKIGHLRPFKLLGKGLSLIGRIIFPRYFRTSWNELRQVSWPSRSESFRLTWAVLIFAILFGGLVAIVDYGLDKLFRAVLLK